MCIGFRVKYLLFLSVCMKLERSQQFSEKKYSNIKFHDNPSSGSRVSCGWTGRHDEANSLFSQFCESGWKWITWSYVFWYLTLWWFGGNFCLHSFYGSTWRWRQQIPLNCVYLSAQLHGVIFHTLDVLLRILNLDCGILDCGFRVCQTAHRKKWLTNFWKKLYSREYTTTRLRGFARKTTVITNNSSSEANIEINNQDPDKNTNRCINPK